MSKSAAPSEPNNRLDITGARLPGTLRESWHAATRPGYAIPVAVFLLLSVMLTGLKVIRNQDFQGDTAIFFQLTENIANRGVPVSQVFANTQGYLESHLLSMPADQMAKNPLAPPAAVERNMLSFHAYFILYPIAVLAKFLSPEIVLLSLYVLSFTGMLLLAYFTLRRHNLPVAAAAIFCLLVVSHPAWSESLLWGQIHPDRYFMFAGFLFMCLASRERTSRIAFIATALLCLSINERAAIVAGGFLLLQVLLYWGDQKGDRTFRLALSIGLLLAGVLILKLMISNEYYSTFLPTNVGQLLGEFQSPAFAEKARLFLLVNSPLLIVALFDWRAAMIAAVLMLPNLVGNFGGAEKIGWSTSYHSYYFPALVWAALMGYAAAFRKATAIKRVGAFYVAAACVALFLSMIGPYSFATPSISPANISNTFLVKFPQQVNLYLNRDGLQWAARGDEVRQAIPEGSIVSTPEALMPYLYHDRTIRELPVGIDRADYAVLTIVRNKNDTLTYGGVTTFLGPAEETKINRLIVARMKKDGYDFAHPTFLPDFPSFAVLKRDHGASG